VLGEPEGNEVREGVFLRREKLPSNANEDSEFETVWRYTVRKEFGDDAFVQLAR
jgi:hypothetical protein